MKLRIAILGTRGIPNQYGGYEQAASFLATGLANKGHEITVYNSHRHPYKEKTWKGVEIVHCKDPEHRLGTMGQFIYDWNCIAHARKRNYDCILMMGYTSSSVWGTFYPKKTTIISNMDGLEWKRSKYSKPVQRFLLYAEKLAIRYSDSYIADSRAIQTYLKKRYNVEAKYIPYGAEVHEDINSGIVRDYDVNPFEYYMLLARMEPENNIEMILDGFSKHEGNLPFLVIGNFMNSFGRKMKAKYQHDNRIRFIGPLFDQNHLNSLRHFCRMYFHGHSVGGTNPSLLEAMASGAMIAAHDNEFNRAVLGSDGFYFIGQDSVKAILVNESRPGQMILNNLQKIREYYNWPLITSQYEALIIESCNQKIK